MQVQATQPETQARTSRFPSKSELIRRVMHEFELYHQFEFEQEIAQNEDMKFEDLDDLFKTGRGFKATVTNYVSLDMDEVEGNNIYADDASSDSEENQQGDTKKKSPGKYGTWFITLDLENQLNERYKAIHELEEIAPAAKEKSALHFMLRSFSRKSGMYENVPLVSKATILKRTQNVLEIVVTETNQNLNKLIKTIDGSDEWDEGNFFACYNDMTTRHRIRELTDVMEDLLEKRVLMGQVLDFLVGKPPMPLENPRYNANLVEPQIARLNPSQQESIRNYLTCESFYLTIGPPGTGKSEVICKFLELCHQMNYRVLVCSMSHAAVDNVLLRFARSDYYQKWRKGPHNIVRHGSPFFIDPASKPYRKVFFEEKGGVDKFKFYTIHFSTLTASFSKYMRGYVEKSRMDFDYILVDEAAMCVDPFIYMAMSLGKKMILAGDHFQLKPIVKHEAVRATTLTKSLFEKLVDAANLMRSGQDVQAHASRVYNILTTQYRMNNLIALPSSRYFYESKVKTHLPISDIDLNDLGARPGKLLSRKTPIVWVDHSGHESEGSMNQTEATIIAKLVEDALYMGIKPHQIGVISAYRAQISLITKALQQKRIFYTRDELLVGTIDAFQGGEREVVIIATTRCNKGQYIGFLKSEERMNVAVTRAKRLCVFVGSVATLIKNEESFIKEFYEFTSSHGEVLRYDRFKSTFKKVKTFTQMSKPAISDSKAPLQPPAASVSTASQSRPVASSSSHQQQARPHEPVQVGRHTDPHWQPASVPATYFPAASVGSVNTSLSQHWTATGWDFHPHPAWNSVNSPHPQIGQFAAVQSMPASRNGGSIMSTSSQRSEAPGIYPAPWGSSPPMQATHYPHQLQTERFAGPVPAAAHTSSPPGPNMPAVGHVAGGTVGPRSTRANVKKGPIQLAANPYAMSTAQWTPTVESGWNWHYEARTASILPAA